MRMYVAGEFGRSPWMEDLPDVEAQPLTADAACDVLIVFAAQRLPWYKAQGCFTEIIRYQTRLFVPVDRLADVLTRLVPQ
jgi:hypothetical protein